MFIHTFISSTRLHRHAYWLWMSLAGVLILMAGCDAGLDDPEPTTALPYETAIKDAATLESATNGVYNNLQTSEYYSQNYLLWPDLATNNMSHTGTFNSNQRIDTYSKVSEDIGLGDVWTEIFQTVNAANNIVYFAQTLDNLEKEERILYEAEGRFLRALALFDAVRLFGQFPYNLNALVENSGIPLTLEPTQTISEAQQARPRASLEAVFNQIHADLEVAENGLPPRGIAIGRAGSLAAKALRARAFLYQEEWQQAIDKSTEVIESGQFVLVPNYADNFGDVISPEHILALQYRSDDGNSLAFWCFPSLLGGRFEYGVDPSLRAEFTKDSTTVDQRFDATIGLAVSPRGDSVYYCTKYFNIGSGADNVPIIRLAEMYLTRAEANNELGMTGAAEPDLNMIRERAGLAPVAGLDQDSLRTLIYRERRLELAFEGHHWFDLVRTGRVRQVLGISEQQALFPIPQRALDRNVDLTQNPLY